MNQTHIETMIWQEKYRPKSLEEVIAPKRILSKLQQGASQHFLLYGGAGRGKTTIAKILAKENPHDFINCSLHTSVENVRSRITEYCATTSLLDGERKKKIVILDEIDGVSDQYFKALRGTIEKYHATTRFIATCNYVNKVPDAILSRFECINFDYSPEEEKEILNKYRKRVGYICKEEGLLITKDALIELVDRKFPDMRSIINSLQGFYSSGNSNINLEDVKGFHGAYKELFELIYDPTKKPNDNYKFLVSNYSNRVDDVIGALGQDFLEYIQLEHPLDLSKLGEIAFEVNRHSYESRFVIDKVVCMVSLVFKIQNIIRK